MKTILITENQFKYLVENIINEQIQSKEEALKQFYKEKKMEDWFVKNIVNKVEEKTYPYSLGYIYYINKNTNKIYMKYDQETKGLYVKIKIWVHFNKNYSDDYEEVEKLIKELVDRHLVSFNINYVVPFSF